MLTPPELVEEVDEEKAFLFDETSMGGRMQDSYTRTLLTEAGRILQPLCLEETHMADHEKSPIGARCLRGLTTVNEHTLRPSRVQFPEESEHYQQFASESSAWTIQSVASSHSHNAEGEAGRCPAVDEHKFRQREPLAEIPEGKRWCQGEPRRNMQRSGRPPFRRQNSKGARARRVPTRMLGCGMAVIRLLWICAFVWAVYGAIFGMDFKNDKAMAQWLPAGPPVANVEPLAMLPPSPYFKPHALTCPRGRVFLADEFHVFELDSATSQVELFQCAINGTIADLTARCEGETCWPVVLLKGTPPKVVDCANGMESPLLQTTQPAKALAARASGALDTVFAAHDHDVIEYRWSPVRQGWEPWWRVMQDPGGVKAVDVTSDQLLIFHEQGTLEAQDYQTGKLCGVWQLPSSLIGAGCAVNGGTSVLVLVPESRFRGPGARLMRATLPQTENSDNCRHRSDETAFGRVSDG